MLTVMLSILFHHSVLLAVGELSGGTISADR
jgi:hypothetical protein